MAIGNYMKVSFIDSNELNDDLIKRIFFNIEKEQYDYADYLIIYGCHIKNMLDERLNHALDIIKNKRVGKIVLSGGIGVNGNFDESEYMLNYLVSNGIDKSRIIVEDKSTTTEESNINIMNILNLKKITEPVNIVLVTQQLHLLRIIMHWNKLLNNSNIKFYYDYVDDRGRIHRETTRLKGIDNRLERQGHRQATILQVFLSTATGIQRHDGHKGHKNLLHNAFC